MKRYRYLIITLGCAMLWGCSHNNNSSIEYTNSIDSLMYHGGNHYDVASYLLNHPDYKDEGKDERLFPYHKSMLSADGKVRVYSIFEDDSYSYACGFSNIVHYGTVRYDDEDYADYFVKADLDMEYCIHQIGTRETSDKTYYLFISVEQYTHQSEYYNFAVSAYSIDKYEYNYQHELMPESVFKTKDGRMLHSIDVEWDDFGFRYNGGNLWGIAFDSEVSTSEVYIQLIDDNPGEPHDSAFVYRWDGSCFIYTGMQPYMVAQS